MDVKEKVLFKLQRIYETLYALSREIEYGDDAEKLKGELKAFEKGTAMCAKKLMVIRRFLQRYWKE